jgi:hypothetical protein
MIELSQIAAYLRLKYEIAAIVSQPDSGFQASRREMSEGLARSMTIAGESWTYSTAKGGYSFTSPRRRFSVFVADDPARHSTFTSPELLGYLRAFTALAELNQLVIDMWLTRAAMRGEVLEAPGGGWRLAR